MPASEEFFMTVQSMGASALSSLNALNTAERVQQPRVGSQSSLRGPGNAEFSKIGQMLSKLESLASSDPEKFKELTAEIAEKLKEAAQGATGREATFLSAMADKFATASREGTTDAIKPPARPENGARPRPYEEASVSASTALVAAHPSAERAGPSEKAKQAWDEIFSLVSQTH